MTASEIRKLHRLLKLRKLKASDKVLYEKGTVKITTTDVAEAITEAEKRVGVELAELLIAEAEI